MTKVRTIQIKYKDKIVQTVERPVIKGDICFHGRWFTPNADGVVDVTGVLRLAKDVAQTPAVTPVNTRVASILAMMSGLSHSVKD